MLTQIGWWTQINTLTKNVNNNNNNIYLMFLNTLIIIGWNILGL